jgi:hypothetical protein
MLVAVEVQVLTLVLLVEQAEQVEEVQEQVTEPQPLPVQQIQVAAAAEDSVEQVQVALV